MTLYVEVEFSNPDDQTTRDIIGPFRTKQRACEHADAIGKAAGLTQNNPNIPGYWVGMGEFEDGNGWHQDVTVTVMVLYMFRPRVRPTARTIKAYLRGDDA